MNTLNINVSIPSLSSLTPIATNTYRFVVKVKDGGGNPLDNPNIANVSTVDVVTTSTTFDIPVPITDGTYTITGVKIEVYSNNDSNCCFASTTATITNTATEESEGEFLTIGYSED